MACQKTKHLSEEEKEIAQIIIKKIEELDPDLLEAVKKCIRKGGEPVGVGMFAKAAGASDTMAAYMMLAAEYIQEEGL